MSCCGGGSSPAGWETTSMACKGGSGASAVCQQSMNKNEMSANCPSNTLCCNLYKVMMDPCSKMLERNIRRMVYGQLDSCCCPQICPPPLSCGGGSSCQSDPCSGSCSPPPHCPPLDTCDCRPKPPVLVSFKCPTSQFDMPTQEEECNYVPAMGEPIDYCLHYSNHIKKCTDNKGPCRN